VGCLKDFGAQPFIVPAMGSHGGATAEGQAEVLASYSITEAEMGVPIRSSMATAQLGSLPDSGLPVFMDKFAYEADGIFELNRVKPHTDFHGEHQSGIVKMLCIGLGKHDQAKATHSYLGRGLRQFIPQVAQKVIDTGKVIGALAIVEDGYDQTSILRVVQPAEIIAADKELLIKARAMMPSIPFEKLDVLLVDRMGKNISGTGMDINIIGRMGIYGEADSAPFSTVIALFDITEESHGNALGIGLADLIPRSLYNKVDWRVTYENIITTNFLRRGVVPVIRETGREVVESALRCAGHITPETARIVRICDTLHLDEMLLSKPLVAELAAKETIEIAGQNLPLRFDAANTLLSDF
jgi:hypothetical protein